MTETTIEIDGIEIDINLELLTQSPDNEEDANEIQKVMEQVDDMPVEIQQKVFDTLLKENAKYKEQKRKIKRLEAISKGEAPPKLEPP